MTAQDSDQNLLPPMGGKLASDSVFTFAASIAARMATALNAIVIIRFLGPHDYGVLSIVILTIAIASLFANLQTPAALVKFLAATSADESRESSRLIGGGLIIVAVSTVLTAAAFAIIAPILAFSLYHDSRIQWLILVALLGMIVSSISSAFFSTFQGFGKIKELGLRNVASAILTIPSTLLLVWLFAIQGAVAAIALNSLIGVVVNVALLRRIWRSRHIRIEVPRERPIYKKILNYALPSLGGTLIVYVAIWYGNTLLALHASFSGVGLYSAGYGLSSFILYIPSAMGIPLIPLISRIDKMKPDDLSTFILRIMRVGAFLTLIPTLVLISMPEPFLRLFYGQVYAGAGYVVRIASPAIFLAGISSIIGYGMAGTGQMKSAMLLNSIWAAILVAMSSLLIPTLGEVGLAVSVLSSYAIHFVAVMIFAVYSWSVRIRQLGMTILISVMSVSVAVVISFFPGWSKVMLASLLLAAVCWAGIRNLSPREIEVLAHPFKKVLSRFRHRS